MGPSHHFHKARQPMSIKTLFPAVLLGAGLLGVALLPAVADTKAEQTKTKAEEIGAKTIEKLIKQLDSETDAEADKAQKQLDDVGVPALEALKKAAAGAGAGKKRAAALVEKIEARNAPARALAAKEVHLVFKDVAVSKA